MVQVIKGRDVFGSIGKGVGQGFAEQFPKEMERNRLSAGLKDFAENAHNLTPLEQFAKVSSIPGVTPQMIQAFPEIAKQQGQANALREKANFEKTAIQSAQRKAKAQEQVEGKAQSITTREGTENTVKNYIPPTYEQKLSRAGQLLNEDPALYKNDKELAMQAVEAEEAQKKAISESYQQRRQNELQVQDRLKDDLNKILKTSNVQIPGSVKNKLEEKAINLVKSKEDGGQGLTEEQAARQIDKEATSISKMYSDLSNVGGFKWSPKETEKNLKTIEQLRKRFEEEDDLINFKDQLIAGNDFSEDVAHYLTYPSSKEKQLNNELVKTKSFHSPIPTAVADRTRQVAKKLSTVLGENGSPLSVGIELRAKGYDPQVWMDYLRENQDKLRLTGRQRDELNKTIPQFPTMNDMWSLGLLGLKKLEEID